MNSKKILYMVIIFFVAAFSLFIACDNADDEKNCDDETNNLRDVNSPSGGDCDDECNDDDDDDDDDDGGGCCCPPEIADGSWDPELVAYDPYEDIWYSWSTFFICDMDDDLSGGNIYYLKAGTNESILDEPFIGWDDYITQYSLDDVTDCANRAKVKLLIEFGSGPDPLGLGLVCVDIEVSDGGAYFSNKLTNLCVYVP